jgi:hypothetical protein
MVRVPAQQPKMTSRIKCFVWNWLRKYAQVHEGNDVDSTPPASTTFCQKIGKFGNSCTIVVQKGVTLVSFLQQIPGFLELVEAASAAVVDFSPLTPLPFCWHSSVAAAIICSPQFLQ